MPPDPARIEAVFLAAAAIPELTARARHVEAACAGDEALKARVLALLAAHDGADSLLDRPVPAGPDPDHAATRDHRSSSAPVSEGVTHTQGAASADPDEALAFLAPPGRPDALGRIGHYDVLEVLGRGGFGIVFRAFDAVLQRVVAVKVLAPQLAATSPARKRFVREARSAAAVRHENVVQVYEVAEAPLPYLTMEFIPGETLQQRIDRTGPFDAAEILRIGRQVAEGLAAAHDQGLVHRDIKPGNILIEAGPQGRVKLTDFGLARAADDASISQSGIVAGTPMYMAPEQAKGDALDHRADLFSLGSVLYTMIAGHPPFRANNTLAVLKRVCEDTPRSLRDVIPEVPVWLCRIVEKLHAKVPDDRYQTAREVGEVLADCERQVKAHGGLRDYSRIPGGKPRRHRTWTAVAAVAVLAPLLAAGVYVLNRPAGRVADVAPTDPPALAVAPFDAAQANAHQQAWAAHLGVPVELTNSIGMTFRLIPPGEFTMGRGDEDPATDDMNLVGGRFHRSQPRHRVTLTRPFFAGVHEVTVQQFRAYIEATKGTTGAEASGLGSWYYDVARKGALRKREVTWQAPGHPVRPRSPVSCVSPRDAEQFCAWLSQKEGRTYRLPTEAEWEYACRAGTTSAYSSGLELRQEDAATGIDPDVGPNDIGSRPANAFGLFDLHGSVSEWCADGPRRYAPAAAVDPVGSDPKLRVARGGCYGHWTNQHQCLQSSGRVAETLDFSAQGWGFRVVLVAERKGLPAPDVTPPPAVAPGEWVSLFNGTDMTGWQVVRQGFEGDEPFRVVQDDGAAAIRVPPTTWGKHAFLHSREEFDNYHLRLEYQVPAAEADADGSFLFHRRGAGLAFLMFKEGRPSVVYPGAHRFFVGRVRDGRVEQGEPAADFMKLAANATRPRGEWNRFEFASVGSVTAFMLNGEVVGTATGWQTPDGNRPVTGGGVGLAAEAGGMLVRRIEVRPITHLSQAVPGLLAPVPLAVAPFDAAQAKAHQEAWAAHLGAPVEVMDPAGMRMRLVPPGEFVMGTPAADLKELRAKSEGEWVRLLDAESPPRPVRLTRPYRIGATEVTRGQFRRFVAAAGYKTDVERGAATGSGMRKGEQTRGPEFTWDGEIGIASTDDHPVVNVTWGDARAYCAWLSKETGRTYRLPTEAEWEFAARAGTATRFSAGDEVDEASHWSWDEVTVGPRPGHRPVAGKRPNPFGLYDVHGNVYEWVQDHFAPFAAADPRDDPTGPATGRTRVRRGGSWAVSHAAQRSASRHEFEPDLGSVDVGFRVVMVGDLSAPLPGPRPKP